MLTTNNCSALIGGATLSNKINGAEMAREKEVVIKKYINTTSLPYQIGGKPVLPGDPFNADSGNVYVNQLVGAGDAVEVTKDNEKDITAKYAPLKANYLKSREPKKKEQK